jgi:hypothetical protein
LEPGLPFSRIVKAADFGFRGAENERDNRKGRFRGKPQREMLDIYIYIRDSEMGV